MHQNNTAAYWPETCRISQNEASKRRKKATANHNESRPHQEKKSRRSKFSIKHMVKIYSATKTKPQQKDDTPSAMRETQSCSEDKPHTSLVYDCNKLSACFATLPQKQGNHENFERKNASSPGGAS